jgi:cytoskeletal protein RodZ
VFKGGDPETPNKGEREQALDSYNERRNRHQPNLRTPPPPPTTFTKGQGGKGQGGKGRGWKERNKAKLDSRGISKNYKGRKPRRDHLTRAQPPKLQQEEAVPKLELTKPRSMGGSKKTPPISPKSSRSESTKRQKTSAEIEDDGVAELRKKVEFFTKQLVAKQKTSQDKVNAEVALAKAAEQQKQAELEAEQKAREQAELETRAAEKRKLETAIQLVRKLFGNAEQGVLRNRTFTWVEAKKEGFKFSELDKTLTFLNIQHERSSLLETNPER